MSELNLTKTRLALLADIAAGHVVEGFTDDYDGETWNTAGAEDGSAPRKVTAAVTALLRAGWITTAGDCVTWVLTAAGRAILDGAK